MAVSLQIFLIVSSLLLSFVISPAAAQLPNNTAVTDFRSSADSPPSCRTHVTYWVRPPYSNLGSISNLFGKSRMDIATATNLSSEDAPLVLNQLLLVPVICTSNGTHYFSNVTYTIKKDDNFYSVQVNVFQNLTESHVVEEMNRKMDPYNLTIGAEAVFPLFCKCPGKSYTDKGIQFLTTYVWQPDDDLQSVSSMFQTPAFDIVMANNNRNFTAAICLPVLIPEKAPILVQLFPSPASHGKFKHRWIVIASLSALAFLIVLLGLAVYFFVAHKKKMMLASNGSSLETLDHTPAYKASKYENFEGKTVRDTLFPGVSGYLCKPIVYDVNVIMKATMNLNERCRIGGSVYKVMINEQVLAVKKTRDAAEEVQILQRVSHANLVNLMGVASDNDGNSFIACEYIENGSLDKWLSPKVSATSAMVEPLSWSQRLVISLDVAHGLHYMHEHTQPSVVHKDIRTSNILLDSNFRAKIANFSAARAATSSIMLNIDVFSFGVVLLELPIDAALSLAMLARACTSENSLERPRMGEVVFNLCVLAQSSPQKSWVSKFEAEEVSPVSTPVEAR